VPVVETGESFLPDPLRGIGSVMSAYARWFGEFPPRASLRKAYAARLNSATSKLASEGLLLQQLHSAIMQNILVPNSPHAAPFVNWFCKLYEVS
jgi:hypothetical protein